MYLAFDPNSGVPVSAQLIEQIKYLVVSGQLTPGEMLPSVRGLAMQLHLNPTTVARVYRQLEAEEILYTQQGRGVFVRGNRSAYTIDEKRRRVRGLVRDLVVEAARIGLRFEEVQRMIEKEIQALKPEGDDE